MSRIIDVVNASGLPGNVKYYWGYQFRLGAEELVPWCLRAGAFRSGDAVAEIGSAEAGVLMAFLESGASRGLATDIAVDRLEMGKRIADLGRLSIDWTSHDIINQQPAEEWQGRYQLAILRDVIEHLDNTEIALSNIRRIMSPGGYLLVTFPPYPSPFGGHQHTLANTAGKFPWIHLLPDSMFYPMIRSGRQLDQHEVRRLRSIRLTTHKFRRAAREAGWQIAREEYYLIRPVYRMKFGLPTVPLTPFRGIPGVQNYLATEALFLLKIPS